MNEKASKIGAHRDAPSCPQQSGSRTGPAEIAACKVVPIRQREPMQKIPVRGCVRPDDRIDFYSTDDLPPAA